MRPVPTEKQLADIPALYSSEEIPMEDKVIHAHFFVGGCDWWISEFDPAEDLFFGFVNLNSPQDAEWGYIDFQELKDIRLRVPVVVNGQRAGTFPVEVEFDLHWTPKPFKEVKRACQVLEASL